VVTVVDRGSGMSDAVFRRARLPLYKTKGSGTGLGLPICREIGEENGGRLGLANRPSGGFRVEARLPVNPVV